MTGTRYWQARLVSKGPYVGVKTFYSGPVIDGEEQDRSPRWQALVGNETTARAILMGDDVPIEIDGPTLRNLEAIDEAAYRYLVAHASWATTYNQPHPAATPRRPIDKRGKSVF